MADGGLPFTKMQAVGNDFVVVEADRWPRDTDWSQVAIRLCDRRFGIGADGLMLRDVSNDADLRARMWNPDGTEDMCGNGTRCVLHLARGSRLLPPSGTIETLSGVRAYHLADDGAITIEMGLPRFAPAEIPTTQPKTQSMIFSIPFGINVLCDAVNTGSTHLVCYLHPMRIAGRFWDGRGAAIEDEPFAREDWFQEISSVIENWHWFPERTSVMWTDVEDRHTLRLRIWERGVGETLGCGTGACASAVAAVRRRVVEAGEVAVHSKGGVLRVGWTGSGGDPVYLTGTAHVTYAGVVRGES